MNSFIIKIVSFVIIIPIFGQIAGFDIYDVDPERKAETIDFLSIHRYEEKTHSRVYNTFDVKYDGSFILGFDNWFGKRLEVYDPNGNFQYGFSYRGHGGQVVAWDDDNACIMFYRGDVIVVIDALGNCVEVSNIDNVMSKDYRYRVKELNSSWRIVNKELYHKENKVGMFLTQGYSLLQKTDLDGNITTLYSADTSSKILYSGSVIFYVLYFVVFVVTFVKGMLKYYKK